jgi:prepilin-type N-terminal cleavage/methylation domain-containing protein
MRRRGEAGFSMIEMIWVIVLMGLLATLGIPRIRDALQKQNVRSARVAAATMVVKARTAAVQRGCRATVHMRGDGRMWVTVCRATGAGLDTIGGMDNLLDRFGVTVTPSRDSVQFGPRGVTLGNQAGTVVVSNSMATDTVTINAVGKVMR